MLRWTAARLGISQDLGRKCCAASRHLKGLLPIPEPRRWPWLSQQIKLQHWLPAASQGSASLEHSCVSTLQKFGNSLVRGATGPHRLRASKSRWCLPQKKSRCCRQTVARLPWIDERYPPDFAEVNSLCIACQSRCQICSQCGVFTFFPP